MESSLVKLQRRRGFKTHRLYRAVNFESAVFHCKNSLSLPALFITANDWRGWLVFAALEEAGFCK